MRAFRNFPPKGERRSAPPFWDRLDCTHCKNPKKITADDDYDYDASDDEDEDENKDGDDEGTATKKGN